MPASRVPLVVLGGLLIAACSAASSGSDTPAAALTDTAAAKAAGVTPPLANAEWGAVTAAGAGSTGKVPVLMVHLVIDTDATWSITKARFKHTIETLYQHGYRPITVGAADGQAH